MGVFFFKGKWIETSSTKEIEIRQTQAKSNSIWVSIFQSSTCPIVTRRFIKTQPRNPVALPQEKKIVGLQKIEQTSKNVFIVHGKNQQPMKDLKTMLFELGLNPIVLHDQPSGGSNTLIEKLERYSDVRYAFVILTPDDIGGSLYEFEMAFAQPEPRMDKLAGIRDVLCEILKKRARQNVVL